MNSPIDQFLEQYYFRHPVNATCTGVRLHDHELPDWTRDARDDEQDEFEALTIALDDAYPATDSSAELAGNPALLDAELARASMDVRQLEFESRFFHDRNPALWTSEAIAGVVALMFRPPATIEEAFASIAMRLHDMPRFLGDLPTTITEPMPAPWVERAVHECAVGADLFRTKLAMWLDASGADDASRLWVLEAGEVAAAALDETARWLQTQPVAPEASLSIGTEAYEILLRRGHFCREEAATLLNRAHEALPDARERYESQAIEVAGSVDALADAMADDHPAAGDLLRTLIEKWDECREFAADHDLVEWSDQPVRFVPMPAWADDAARRLDFPSYRSPSPHDARDEQLYFVTPIDATLDYTERERRRRQWNHAAITLEHVVRVGALGRHVQLWHAVNRSPSKIGAVAGIDCAGRVGLFQGSSMTDGWSCYAAELADELGFLTPLEQAAVQHERVRLIAHAIVDLSLHTGVMSFDDAVDFFAAEVGVSHTTAMATCVRASMFPGTAVAGWLGTQGMLQLRHAMRAHDGPAFSNRRFHDALLNRGSIPVLLAAKLMLGDALGDAPDTASAHPTS